VLSLAAGIFLSAAGTSGPGAAARAALARAASRRVCLPSRKAADAHEPDNGDQAQGQAEKRQDRFGYDGVATLIRDLTSGWSIRASAEKSTVFPRFLPSLAYQTIPVAIRTNREGAVCPIVMASGRLRTNVVAARKRRGCN
jgi:hypothetical protein